MLDVEIRTAVERRLRSMHRKSHETLYRHELGLRLGETRVDVAAINGKLTGCEIKGSRDRLTRLPRQIDLYSQVMDHSYLVVEERHLVDAMGLLPDFWGLWMARPGLRGAVIEPVRRAKQSPRLDPHAIVQLVWRDEGLGILRRRGLAGGMSRATRFQVWDALVDGIPDLSALRAEVRQTLRDRTEWPGGELSLAG